MARVQANLDLAKKTDRPVLAKAIVAFAKGGQRNASPHPL